MSVYTCLFTTVIQQGRIPTYSSLVGLKRFIKSREPGPVKGFPVQLNPAVAITENPGQFVYPGGRIHNGDNLLDTAMKKFQDETGVDFQLNATGTKVRLNKYVYPVKLIEMAGGFSCVYVKADTVHDLNVLKAIIQANIDANTTASDELQSTEILQLTNYKQHVPTAAIINYCAKYLGQLQTTRDLHHTKAFLNGGLIQVPPPSPTTQSGDGPTVSGVAEFNKQCYDMGPFMNFIKNTPTGVHFDFPHHTLKNHREYAFLKPTDDLPSQFSTDWFSQISENIPAVSARM